MITWFVITEFAVILLGDLPPLSLIEGAFLKYFGIPVALTWFMSQKTFDGKKPYSFLKSQITFALRPKVTYAGKAVKLEKEVFLSLIHISNSVMTNHVIWVKVTGNGRVKSLIAYKTFSTFQIPV